MSQLLSERLRQALREFKHAAAVRAKLEMETEAGFRERSQALESEHNDHLRRIERAFREGTAEAEHEIQEARTRVQAQFEGEETRAGHDMEKAKRQAIKRYVQGKEQAVVDFKEARWTITTVYDAGRKVAKDQLGAAVSRTKEALGTLQGQHHEALLLLQRWQFANDLPLMTAPGPHAAVEDPAQALAACALQGTQLLAELRALTLPDHVRGLRPFLILTLLWILASLPALFLTEWNVVYWLLATTGTIPPFGLLLRWWLRARARTQAVYLWSGLSQALTDATHLRPRCLELARQTYRAQKKENKRRNEEALAQAAIQTRKKVQALRQERSQKLRHAQATYEPLQRKQAAWRERELMKAETTYREKQTALKAAHDQALRELNDHLKKNREEVNRRHADDWTRLVGQWKQACDKFLRACRAVDQETRRWFPPWDDAVWENWELPTEVPDGLLLGTYDVRLEDIPHGLPTETHLQRPDLSALRFPILLPFPERASLLLKAHDAGKAVAVEAVQALLLRCWTGLPAGKMRCTIIDPVGRGENFAAFMHLADHEETLVASRIWTEAAHIEQRLADLTAHMENVLQKYLRNQFETLAEYNAQAGEVAEPYRFLVVADFPVNFTPDAARRLISLAGAGARCGIYTFIMFDQKQELPRGIEQADLERACTVFTWKNTQFVWHEPDFGPFPMALEEPPDAATCTRLLGIAGEAAKNAGRVEVPFELIAPPDAEWWQADSRQGIAVPLGRVGATSRQMLNLGQGTAQHVLIAGKTGSGKSTLLHVLIAQLATRYSPHEVELYLVDFKKGVEFKTYAVNELPHARVVAVESEREFGLSVLQRLDAELVRRGELFRAGGVNDLPSFRSLNGTGNGKPHSDTLPRLVLIVDEFQEFFVEDDKIAQEAALLLDRLVRQGRAFGIHVLLGSQTLGGAYSLARSTIDQMAVRIALQCSEADAHLILSKDNSEARLLSRPGEAIYNASGGLLEGNHFFQVVWLSDAQRDDTLRKVHQLAHERSVRLHQIVFEGTSPANLLRNPLLAQALAQPPSLPPQAPVQAWLGEAVSIKDPTAAVFRRQSGANLLMVGQQDQAAFSLMVAVLVSLSTQLPRSTDDAPRLNLVVAHPLEQEAEAVQAVLPEVLQVTMVTQRDLPATLSALNERMEARLKGEQDGAPHFLFLYGLHRLRDLRRPEDDFNFARKGETTVSPFKQFMTLLREGPPLGLFTVVWCDTLTNLQRTFDRPSLRELEMRVLFQMSPTDSSTLMDTPLAAKLGMNRALFYTEDQGRVEKFRPYALPPIEWLRELASTK